MPQPPPETCSPSCCPSANVSFSGPEHRYALIMRGNIAHWTGEEGAPAAARDLFAELLPVYERVMGAEHPDTLDIHTKLAHWTEQGRMVVYGNIYCMRMGNSSSAVISSCLRNHYLLWPIPDCLQHQKRTGLLTQPPVSS